MFRRKALFFSILFLACGLVLTNSTVALHIISFLNTLHLHLDIEFRTYGLFYCGCLLIALSLITALFYLKEKEIIPAKRLYPLSYSVLTVFYFFFLWKDSINMPVTDDYRVLIFFSQYSLKTSLAEKWDMIIRAPLECRIMEVPKLALLGVYYLFGSINFRWLILVNGFLLLIICRIIFNSFQHPQRDLLQLAFFFLVLQFQSFDSAFWAVAGISYYWTFLFVILAIKETLKGASGNFFFSFLFATLAAFTLGNGLLVFPLCCFIYYTQSRIKQCLAFALLLVVVNILYFYFWPYPEEASTWEFNPLRLLVFALGFLGSAMQFMYSLYIPVLVGLICIGIFIYATIKKYYKENFFVWALLLFIILSAFITAPLRLKWGPLQSRYGFYSIIAIVLSLIALIELLRKKQFSVSFVSLLLIAIGYNFLSGIMFYPEAPVRKAQLQELEHEWKNRLPLTIYSAHTPDNAQKYLDDAKSSGIWNGR